jgi:hypothetical protein
MRAWIKGVMPVRQVSWSSFSYESEGKKLARLCDFCGDSCEIWAVVDFGKIVEETS